MQRRRCVELGLAGLITLSGCLFGAPEPSSAHDMREETLRHMLRDDWNINQSIRTPFKALVNRTGLTPETARSAQAILAVRAASNLGYAPHANSLNYTAPGPGHLEIAQMPSPQEAMASLYNEDDHSSGQSVQVSYVLPVVTAQLTDTMALSIDTRSGFGVDGDISNVSTSGQLELITRLDKDKKFPHWSLFVGGERQALFLNQGMDFSLQDGLSFENFATVGRAQGGAAWRFSQSASVSLSYMYEETSVSLTPHQSWKEEEHSLGLVFERRW